MGRFYPLIIPAKKLISWAPPAVINLIFQSSLDKIVAKRQYRE